MTIKPKQIQKQRYNSTTHTDNYLDRIPIQVMGLGIYQNPDFTLDPSVIRQLTGGDTFYIRNMSF